MCPLGHWAKCRSSVGPPPTRRRVSGPLSSSSTWQAEHGSRSQTWPLRTAQLASTQLAADLATPSPLYRNSGPAAPQAGLGSVRPERACQGRAGRAGAGRLALAGSRVAGAQLAPSAASCCTTAVCSSLSARLLFVCLACSGVRIKTQPPTQSVSAGPRTVSNLADPQGDPARGCFREPEPLARLHFCSRISARLPVSKPLALPCLPGSHSWERK